MRTIEQLEEALALHTTIFIGHPNAESVFVELIALAKYYRSNAKHDSNVIKLMAEKAKREGK